MATNLVNPISGITPSQLSQPFTRGTSVNTTSGTAIDFTSIPNWVKRITLSLNAVSTNGTAFIRLQIGSGSIDTTGYASTASYIEATVGSTASTAGFDIYATGAALVRSGNIELINIDSNTWICSGVIAIGGSGTFTSVLGGVKSLAGTLDRIRLTTQNGTDTFDNGSVNISYE